MAVSLTDARTAAACAGPNPWPSGLPMSEAQPAVSVQMRGVVSCPLVAVADTSRALLVLHAQARKDAAVVAPGVVTLLHRLECSTLAEEVAGGCHHPAVQAEEKGGVPLVLGHAGDPSLDDLGCDVRRKRTLEQLAPGDRLGAAA